MERGTEGWGRRGTLYILKLQALFLYNVHYFLWHIPGAGQRGAEEAASLQPHAGPAAASPQVLRPPPPRSGSWGRQRGVGRGWALPAHISSPASLVTVSASSSFLPLSLSPPLPVPLKELTPVTQRICACTSLQGHVSRPVCNPECERQSSPHFSLLSPFCGGGMKALLETGGVTVTQGPELGESWGQTAEGTLREGP